MSRTSQPPRVLERMHALMHGLKHHMREAMHADGEGLGMMEARCLRYFAHHPGATQSDLVQHAGRDKAQIARIVKGLIERELLCGQPNPADGRSQVLRVSTKGSALQSKMQGHEAAFERRLMRGLDADERATLVALLERLEHNASAR
ncbi:MAG: MarR family winged helix-turn-helix transcriptional regulator [Burkholderiaceae bacterium]